MTATVVRSKAFQQTHFQTERQCVLKAMLNKELRITVWVLGMDRAGTRVVGVLASP